MRSLSYLLLYWIAISSMCVPCFAQSMKRIELPNIDPPKSIHASDAEKQEIRQLIADLASVDQPALGISERRRGSTFAPLPSIKENYLHVEYDPKFDAHGSFRRLVELGPKSLPYLLESLTDSTPTRLSFKSREGIFGGMHLCQHTKSNSIDFRELDLNPMNDREQQNLTSRNSQTQSELTTTSENTPFPFIANFEDMFIDNYQVKVGDVCMVAIGQITGRRYWAVSAYKFTPVLSPTHDHEIAKTLREVWNSNDPCKMIWSSYLCDFSTRGVPNDRGLDQGWVQANQLQCAAAMRLLYYFPGQADQLIAARLDSLNAEYSKELSQIKSDEVYAEDLISVVSWSKSAEIQSALQRLRERTVAQKP